MGFHIRYRCCNYIDQSPVVKSMRTLLAKDYLSSPERTKVLSELSGVSEATLKAWFEKGTTRDPRWATVAAVMGAAGFEQRFVKVRVVNESIELPQARAWNTRQKTLREAAKTAEKTETKQQRKAA